VVEARASGDPATAEEIVLRVQVPGRPVAVAATLYPFDEEWDCDCGGDSDACEHVAAAVIALRRAREKGDALPVAARQAAQLSYRFQRDGQRLALERFLVWPDGREKPLESSLASVIAGAQGSAYVTEVTPTQEDLAIERILEVRRLRSLPFEVLESLLPLLAEARDVRLEGRRVAVDTEAVMPRGVVEDSRRGFRLTIDRADSIEEVVIAGLALCRPDGAASEGGAVAAPAGPDEARENADPVEAVLRPLGATQLSGLQLERLPNKREFGRDTVAELVTEVLPKLTQSITVDVRSRSLPRGTCQLDARCLVEVDQQGEVLSVLPLLVYGDPPCARVDGDRLEHLQGPLVERDPRAERREAARLLQRLDLVVGRRTRYLGLEACEMAKRLRRWSGDVAGTAHRDRYPDEALEPAVQVGADRCSVRFVVAGAGERDDGREPLEATAEAVVRAWQEGANVVALDGGGWAPLPVGWLDNHGHRVADLLAARRPDGELEPCGRSVLLQLCDELDEPRPPELSELAPLVDGFDGIGAAELPGDLQGTLRGYQQQGLDWLEFLRRTSLGAILADDMGLGKTLQAMCTFHGRTLVVCPTSVVHNWADELKRFRPKLNVGVYRGRGRVLDPAWDVTLTSFALLRLDIEVLAVESWDVVVLDEAQAIKNPESQVAQAAYRLRSRFRLAMSGTPVENRLDELWSLAHFTNRGLLGGRRDFRERYAGPIADGQPGAAARLRARIRPFVLRRTKSQVAPELPPRSESVMLCELSEVEREIYDAVRAATKRQVVQQLEAGGNVLAALEALLRLRQAACHPDLVPGQQADRSAKVERLLLALDQIVAGGHKALVFSQWTSLLDRVEPHLHEAGIEFTRLDGSTRDRQGVVASFQDSAGPPVMLLSLKAGGTGLNLTAADHVFLLDPWWNPAVEEQAADRAHRIGQDRPVMIYRLVAKDTVEERILLLQDKKRALAEAALGGADQAGGLTRDDLLALLGD
jgi:superfamily II DNA or RNA helicase